MQNVKSLTITLLLGLIVCCLFLFSGCSYTNTFPEGLGETIDESDELKAIIESYNQDYIIVDVRPEYKYKEGHIPSAINIPNGELQSLENPPPKDKYLILNDSRLSMEARPCSETRSSRYEGTECSHPDRPSGGS